MEQRECGGAKAADRLECGVLEVGPAAEIIDLGRVRRLIVIGAISMTLAVVASGLGAARIRPGVDPARPLSSDEFDVLVAVAEASTVSVRSQGCGRAIRGSGVVVGGQVVTNRHLSAGADQLSVAGPTVGGLVGAGVGGDGGPPVPAMIVRRSTRHDLVLADGVVPGEWGRGVDIAEGDPVVGEPVLLAGRFPEGLRWVATRVHLVIDGSAYGLDGLVLFVATPTVPGFSGGPVLNRDGELVGVLQALDRSTALGLAVPVSELAAWLNGADEPQADISCINASRSG